MKHPFFKKRWKRGIGFCMSFAMAASLMPAVPAVAETRRPLQTPLPEATEAHPNPTKAGSISASENTISYDQPFEPYTAGVENFRIPSLLTLQNGDLLAGGDARWEEWNDGGGIDSVASVSSDGGQTWNYSFPIYFPDSYGYAGRDATTIIDPGVVEGPDGTVYFIADVNPTGSTTMYKTIGKGSGYVTVDGKRYMALTENFSTSQNRPTDSDLTSYPYYIDHFDENGYAQIKNRSDKSPTGYGVDEWYNLYTVDANGQYVDNLTQKQVNSDTDIQQNVYYKGSKFHVYNIDYIWVVESKDHGRTWGHPHDITDQIKRESDNAILISPGKSISTSSGDIVIGLYYAQSGEKASMLYSSDNGQTWGRTEDVPDGASSEDEIVELADGTLRMFYRNNHGKLTYADFIKNEDGGYDVGQPVQIPSPGIVSTCNLSVVSYSQKIEGKQALLISCPKGDGGGDLIYQNRNGGRIYTFLVDDEQPGNPLKYYGEFVVPGGTKGFVYSSMTELANGSIGLLWEPNHSTMYFDVFDIYDVLPDQVELEGVSINVKLEKGGEAFTRTYGDGTPNVTEQADASIARVTLENETRTHILRDHIARNGGSINSFSGDVNMNISLEDAEFSLTAAGEGTSYANRFIVYNEATGQYLTNVSSAETLFSQTAVNDMKFEPVNNGESFTICKGTTNDRYLIFYSPQMNFNSNSGKGTSGIENMCLFERKDSVAKNDLVPGYKKVSAIEKGHSYLITYIYNDNVMVLYPTNGTDDQTKLLGTYDQMQKTSKKKITIEGVGSGVTKTVIDGITYDIHVTDPSIVLNPEDEYEIKGASAITQAPSNSVVISAAVYNEASDGLFDHKGADDGEAFSLESFSETKNDSISLSNAELTFTSQGNNYQVKDKDGRYLNIKMNWQDTFFADAACNLTVTKNSSGNTFKIARADHVKNNDNGNIGDKWGGIMGHFVFYFRQMDFRSHGMAEGSKYQAGGHGIGEYGTHADYNLTLLEKADGATDGPLPGYRVASSVTSGSKYLISYIYDDSVIVLYPADGTAAQTKLAKRANKGVRITAKAVGDSSVTIDGTVYEVHVKTCSADHDNKENLNLQNTVAASCLGDGYTGDKVCKTCGKVIETGRSISALGHDWNAEGTSTRVTETADGETLYTCKRDNSHTKKVIDAHASVYKKLMSQYNGAGEILDVSDRYDAEAVGVLRNSYNQAKDLIENVSLTDSVMNPVISALQAGSANVLSLRNELEEELDEALQAFKPICDAGPQEYYDEAAWEAFEAAYEAAKDVTENTAYLALQQAVSDLQTTGIVLQKLKYRTDLQELYALHKDKTQGEYNDTTWQAFVTARDAAKATLENQNASVAELIEAWEDLQAAVDGLRTPVEALAPQIRYTVPVAGEYPQAPTVIASGDDNKYQTEIADLAENPVVFTRVDTSGNPVIERRGNIWGFNDQIKSGANDDKFDVAGGNPIIISFKLYLNKRANSGSNLGLVTKGDHQYAVQLTNTGLNFYLNPSDNTGAWPTETCAISDKQLGQWLDVFAVNDGKGKMRLYVDGSVSSTHNPAAATLTHYNAPFAIGCRYNDSGSIDQKFTSEFGYLADVKFYSGADMTADMKTAINLETLGDDAFTVIQNLAQSMEPTANITVSPYNVKTAWRQAEGSKTPLAGTERFAADVAYEAVTTFTANGDYEFLDSEEFINGVVKNVSAGLKNRLDVKANVVVSNDKKTMTATVSFGKSAKPEITVELNPSKKFSLEAGQTRQIIATTNPAGVAVTWASSDDNIATVSATGLVTAIAKGEAVITAAPAGGTPKSVTVTVGAPTTEPDKKEELSAAVEAADTLLAELESNKEDYTPESVEALKAAVANAKQALANADLTDEELGKILEALKGVQPETKVEAAKRQLTDEISGAKTDAGNQNYTSASIQVLNRAIEKAETALKNGASAEEMQNLLKEIQTARENLAYITYTVTFDGNGGSPAPSAVKVQIGKSLARPAGTLTRSGYDFLGWSTAKNGAVVKWPLPVTGNITLYAQWQQKAQQEQPLKFEDGAEKTDVKTKMKYKVVSAKKMTVMVVQGTDKNAKSINIPATVKIDNKTWKIVTVGKNAFKGYGKATKLTLGKYVTAIEQNAFNGCRKLKTITMKGKTIKSVKSGAFKNTSKNLTVKVPKSVKKAQKKKLQTMLRKKGNKKLKVK